MRSARESFETPDDKSRQPPRRQRFSLWDSPPAALENGLTRAAAYVWRAYRDRLVPELRLIESERDRQDAFMYAQASIPTWRWYPTARLSRLGWVVGFCFVLPAILWLLSFALFSFVLRMMRQPRLRDYARSHLEMPVVAILFGAQILAYAGIYLGRHRNLLRRDVRAQLSTLGTPICIQCGYNLAGNASGICPECGQPIKPANTSQSNAQHSR